MAKTLDQINDENNALIFEYQEWCEENGLSDEGCAVHLMQEMISKGEDEKAKWLKDFNARWNANRDELIGFAA